MFVLFGGWGVNIYPTNFDKSSWNFLPIFEGVGCKMSAEDDENSEKRKIGTDLEGRYYLVGHSPHST